MLKAAANAKMVKKTITLNNGVEMPMVGFGTYQITDPEVCAETVSNAIKVGYHLIDAAPAYGNELSVGEGIKRSGIKREDLFVTSKVWFTQFEPEQTRKSVMTSLERLGLDYLDLVLLHWPFGNVYGAWRTLEDLYAEGKIRAIGVSNFAASQLVDLITYNKVVPAVNQIETNLLCQQFDLRKWMDKYNVAHQAYAPFGQGIANEMFSDPRVIEVAEKYGKSTRQVALRYMIQRGIGVVPKSNHVERMKANLEIFDFELSEEDMEKLRSMDRGQNLIFHSQAPETVEIATTWPYYD